MRLLRPLSVGAEVMLCSSIGKWTVSCVHQLGLLLLLSGSGERQARDPTGRGFEGRLKKKKIFPSLSPGRLLWEMS